MKTKNEKKFEEIKKRTIAFVRKEPVLSAGIVIFSIIVICWLVSSLEIFPEPAERVAANGAIVEPGDSMTWIGMRVIQLTRSIRKEFNIPGKIKGMFVLDEGKDLALKYGVKTGDVIVSIGRKPVPTAKAFVNIANNVKYTDGILLDIYRDGQKMYLTIPFEYQYGPLMGPNKGTWQMGSPVFGPAFQYGPIYKGNNPNQGF
ncbi:MAG: hypothetical protein HQL24_02820 [Candidatus Omnitrophica bacterium]|nr:hypothetical protein [Candidatus Omnitrophota bacterium]